VIPSVTTYNFAVNYDTPRDGLSLFLAGTNLTDKTHIVSRVDGIQVSRPRTVFGGVNWSFQARSLEAFLGLPGPGKLTGPPRRAFGAPSICAIG
jgi:hypothetical protein